MPPLPCPICVPEPEKQAMAAENSEVFDPSGSPTIYWFFPVSWTLSSTHQAHTTEALKVPDLHCNLTMGASSWHLNMLRRGLGPPAEQSLTPSFSSCSGSRSSKPSPPPQLHPQSVPGVWTHKPRASPADCLGRLRKLSLWKLSSC